MAARHLLVVAGRAALLVIVLLTLSLAGRARAAIQQESSGAFTQAVRLQLGADGAREVPDMNRTWIARSNDIESIYEVMTDDGYVFVEQLGSGHLFERDGQTTTIECRSYTSWFVICERPIA